MSSSRGKRYRRSRFDDRERKNRKKRSEGHGSAVSKVIRSCYAITPTLHYSNTPLLQHSITPTLHHSNTPLLQHSITPTLHYSNTQLIQHFDPATGNPAFPTFLRT